METTRRGKRKRERETQLENSPIIGTLIKGNRRLEKKPLEKEQKKRHKHFPFYYVRIELRRKSHNFSQFIIGPFSGEGGQIILQSGGGGGSYREGGGIFIPSLPFLSPFPSPSLVGNYIQVFSHIMPAIPVTPDMRRRRQRRPVQGKGGGSSV